MADSVGLLRAIGAGLYGRQWQSALAEALGINDRTMRRWISGDWNIPYDAWARLEGLMIDRGMALEGLRAALAEFLAGDIRSKEREQPARMEEQDGLSRDN